MRRKKKARKAVSEDKDKDKELILKTKSEWIKNALVNKTKYQKKYSDSQSLTLPDIESAEKPPKIIE